VILTFDPPDNITGEVEAFLKEGLGKAASEEKIALIRILAARIVEERFLTKELHDTFLEIELYELPNDLEELDDDAKKAVMLRMKKNQGEYIQRDSLIKRLEALSRIISSIWNQLGFAGTSPTRDFLTGVGELIENRECLHDGTKE